MLRPKLQGLANRGVKAGEENERREYVDNVTKRVVRDNIGVGDGGEMDLGKNVTNEEVLAMEGVVGEKS